MNKARIILGDAVQMIDRSRIFKSAHTIAKKAIHKFASYAKALRWALKKAWENEVMRINELCNSDCSFRYIIERETDKAVFVYCSGFDAKFWMPKSVVTIYNGMISDVSDFGLKLIEQKSNEFYASCPFAC